MIALAREVPPVVAVVEDNPDAAEAIAMLLEFEGCQPVCFTRGRRFLDALPSLDPAAVILDLAMPGMDGIEVLRRIRAAGHHDLPVVIVTGQGEVDDFVNARALGVTSILRKPLGISELPSILRAAL